MSEMSVPPDLAYHPVLADATEFLTAYPTERFLLLGRGLDTGQGLPDGFEAVPALRVVAGPEVELPVGNYRFRSAQGVAVMVVSHGSPAGPPESGHRTPTGDSRLERAEGWLEHLWSNAPDIPRPVYAMNDPVVTDPGGQDAQIVRRRLDAEGGVWRYSIRVGGKVVQVLEPGIAPPPESGDPHDWIQEPSEPARCIAATLTRAKLREQLTDTVYSFRATRTIFRPYQFRPVMKLLRTGRHRLLIADEVGLGKTIEAGLIWTEFDARGQADRVLVVCPSMLVPKWIREMDERFGFEVKELSRERLEEVLGQLEVDRLPARFRGVCSLERLRIWDGLERLNDLAPRFDLVICDEAHAFRNLGTKSHGLGSLMADWAEALVFLSATPLNLGNDDLFNLLQLLEPGEFDDIHTLRTRLEPNALLNRISASLLDSTATNEQRLELLRAVPGLTYGAVLVGRPEFSELEELLTEDVLDHAKVARAKRLLTELHTLSTTFTRTRKVEVSEDQTTREPHTVQITLTDQERALYDAVHAWQAKRAAASGLPLHFQGQMPLRLAGSCLPAMRDRILSGSYGWSADMLDPPEDDGDDATVGVVDVDAPTPEVIAAARALGDIDTKFDLLLEPLEQIVGEGRQVLAFSFSRPTVAYLERRLGERFRVAVLHGDVKSKERQNLMARFRSGEFDILVASRVASEGLDFEFCGAVVNYDLPWNPMEVEQRIGRIDRFGQEEDVVYVVNLHTPGTIEADIIARVHQRIGVFNDSIGELEPIIGQFRNDLNAVIYDFALTPEQRQEQIERILTAVETKSAIIRELEDEQGLRVLDDAEIDGFEDEVVRTGRYVGQPELVWLLEDWASFSAGARCEVSDDGYWLYFRGTADLAEHLYAVQAAGERSASEIADLAARLRDETEIILCLDQETARKRGADLLNTTHPLVRAALQVPGVSQCRYGSARIRSRDLDPGTYTILVGVARWNGVRPASEFWTSAVDAAGEPLGNGPGDALLAVLAAAGLGMTDGPAPATDGALADCQRQLDRWLDDETERRVAENRTLAEARRLSLRESHDRKIAQIRQGIATLQESGNPGMIPLFESRIRAQEHRLGRDEQALEEASKGSMDLEYVAVCLLEVVHA